MKNDRYVTLKYQYDPATTPQLDQTDLDAARKVLSSALTPGLVQFMNEKVSFHILAPFDPSDVATPARDIDLALLLEDPNHLGIDTTALGLNPSRPSEDVDHTRSKKLKPWTKNISKLMDIPDRESFLGAILGELDWVKSQKHESEIALIKAIAEREEWPQIKKCLSEAKDITPYAKLIRQRSKSLPLLQVLAEHEQLDLVRALIACHDGSIYTVNNEKDDFASIVNKIKDELDNLIHKIADTIFFPDTSNYFTLPDEIKEVLICRWIRAEYCASLPDNIEKHLIKKVFEKEGQFNLEAFKERELSSICRRSFWFYFLNKGTELNSEWLTAPANVTPTSNNIIIHTGAIGHKINDAVRGIKGARSTWTNDITINVPGTNITSGRKIVLKRQDRLHQIIRKGFFKHEQQFNERLLGAAARNEAVNLIGQSEHIDLESCSKAFAEAAKCATLTEPKSLTRVKLDDDSIKTIKEFAKECAQEHQDAMGTRYSGFWASGSGVLAIANIVSETMIILAREGELPLNFADDEHAEQRNELFELIASLKVINKSLVTEAVESMFAERPTQTV